jgi:Zn finger protein HypA/HybF involved in hydrogenase expression
MALQRCTNCGHTDDFSLTNFVCPSCDVELELLPGEMSMTTIALCSLKGGTYNHVWRFVTARLSQPTINPKQGRALWQCDDCHRIVEGRAPDIREAQKIDKGEDVIVQSVEIP